MVKKIGEVEKKHNEGRLFAGEEKEGDDAKEERKENRLVCMFGLKQWVMGCYHQASK